MNHIASHTKLSSMLEINIIRVVQWLFIIILKILNGIYRRIKNTYFI